MNEVTYVVGQPSDLVFEQLELQQIIDVLPMRARAYQADDLLRPELADLTSRHYLLRRPNLQAVAGIRVGTGDPDLFLPPAAIPDWMKEKGFANTGFPGRFFSNLSSSSENVAIARVLFGRVWENEIRHAVNCSISIVRSELIPLYLRMGNFYVVGSGHRDALNRICCIMLAPANSLYASPFRSVFQAANPLDIDNEILEGRLIVQYRAVKEQLQKEILKVDP